MRIRELLILLFFSLYCGQIAHSQESRTEFSVDFRINSTYIDPTYSNNSARLREIKDFLQRIRQDDNLTITSVSFCGAVSPEGSYQLNRKLAQGRLSSLQRYVLKEINIHDSLITHNDSYIPWEYLKTQIKGSDLLEKEAVMTILDEEPQLVDYISGGKIDNRILKIKQLSNGKVWQQMNRLFFEKMRNAYVIFVTYKKAPAPEVIPVPEVVPETKVVAEPEPEPEPEPELPAVEEVITPKVADWSRKLYIKTNVAGWVLGVANAAVEIDIAKHLSFSVPVYYSAWNYFKSTIKFRVFAIQPELRYWVSDDNNGFFAAAHFGLVYYDLAVNGGYRYQDHNGQSPAIGGGVNVGYRLPLSKSKKWSVEFSLGVGGYNFNYDTFYNVDNGKLIDTQRKTYWGIDHASVSLSHAFNLKKNGGKR